MTQQMGELMAAFHPILASLRQYALGLIGFQAVLLLLQQNRKYKVVHILAYLPRLDIAVRPNGVSGRVSGNGITRFQVAI
jgi:hypothetical protein